MKIPVEISARHIHLTKEDFEKLFGTNKKLTPLKYLSQPGEFLSKEKLKIVNGNKEIKNVGIIGPFRKDSQVEISLTDAYTLKLKKFPEMKISGHLVKTKILVKGLKSSIKLPCIISHRHIHCSNEESKKLKLKNHQLVSVKINGERSLTFHNVLVRVSENYKLSFHIDTDEGNSAGIFKKTFGEIIKN